MRFARASGTAEPRIISGMVPGAREMIKKVLEEKIKEYSITSVIDQFIQIIQYDNYIDKSYISFINGWPTM
jgi:hypothetical protein